MTTLSIDEIMTRELADRTHDAAQNKGSAKLYTKAAELYEELEDWRQAKVCRDAAARLELAK